MVLLMMEQTNDWKRESAWAISIWFPPPITPTGSIPAAWISSTGL